MLDWIRYTARSILTFKRQKDNTTNALIIYIISQSAMSTFATMIGEFEDNLTGVFLSVVSVAATFVMFRYMKRHPTHVQRDEIIAHNPPPEETTQERTLLDSIIPHLMRMQESIRSAKQDERAVFGDSPESLDIVLGRMGSAVGSIFNDLRDQAIDDPEYTSKQLRHRLAWEYADSTEECIRRRWYIEREEEKYHNDDNVDKEDNNPDDDNPNNEGEATATATLSRANEYLDEAPFSEYNGPLPFNEWLDRRMREFYERYPRGVFSCEHEESD